MMQVIFQVINDVKLAISHWLWCNRGISKHAADVITNNTLGLFYLTNLLAYISSNNYTPPAISQNRTPATYSSNVNIIMVRYQQFLAQRIAI